MLLATSCRSSTPGPALPTAAPVVQAVLEEYRFTMARPIPAGRVVFRFVNNGSEAHRPVLFPLPEDLPPLDEQVRGTKRRAISPFAGVHTQLPGAKGTFAVDLVQGKRYGFICVVKSPKDDRSHSLKGMTFEFRAGVAGDPGPVPSTSVG